MFKISFYITILTPILLSQTPTINTTNNNTIKQHGTRTIALTAFTAINALVKLSARTPQRWTPHSTPCAPSRSVAATKRAKLSMLGLRMLRQ